MIAFSSVLTGPCIHSEFEGCGLSGSTALFWKHPLGLNHQAHCLSAHTSPSSRVQLEQ